MHRWFTGVFILATTTLSLSAQTLTLPAAANVEGVNHTHWRTDLQVMAQGDTGAVFSIELLETGADNTDPVSVGFTVEPGESLRLGNILETDFDFTGTAALRLVVVEGSVLATSRTYNDAVDGTYGQTVPAVADHDAFVHGVEATLIQLSRSPDPADGFRTNIGLVNLTGSRLVIEIDLFAADSSGLGKITRSLEPHEHRQINDVFHVAGADDVADGYAVVRTPTEDGRFIPYASVVDNGSGDAVFMLARLAEPPPQPRLVVFEHFMAPG